MNALARHLNVSAFIFSYRGYGRSEGTPSEQVRPGQGRARRAPRPSLLCIWQRGL